MATTQTPADMEEVKYRRNYWREYVRMSGFKAFMGNDPMSIIHTAFETTKGGKSIKYPLISRLSNNGTDGNARLSGSEEALGKHLHQVTVRFRRNAVELDKQDEHYDFANARETVRPLLKEWSMDKLRSDIIDAFSMVLDGKTVHAPLNQARHVAASEAEKDTWLDNNEDRALFGNEKLNTVPSDHSASLNNVTAATGKLSANSLTLMKRIAKNLSIHHIRPVRVGEQGREFFQVFCDSRTFRDLKTDDIMTQANREARPRDVSVNPLFQDGDLIWDGMVIREIPEIPVIVGAGAAGVDIGQVFLCGAQSVAIGWGQLPRFTTKKEDDYDFFSGIGIEEMMGVNKIQRNINGLLTDNGVLTGYFAAAEDA